MRAYRFQCIRLPDPVVIQYDREGIDLSAESRIGLVRLAKGAIRVARGDASPPAE
jgi:hypothetical protein